MDRQIIYPGQIPLETDLLNTNRNTVVGLAKLAAAMLGTGTIVNGLACAPTSPASLQVTVNPGEMYALAALDATAYSSLAADTTHNILKQGISLDAITLSCPAPASAGQSVNYLIQATYLDTDSGLVALPYYNASNPSQAWSGPGNTGAQQATVRRGVVNISTKPGVAAPTGTQTTPAPDTGYTGLWVVTVANGQSTIAAANISQAANAPILPTDLLHAMQQSGTIVGTDTGAANACAVSYSPAITALTDGMVLWFAAKAANSGATTLNVNGLGAVPVVGAAHSALQGGEIVAGGRAQVVYRADISSWVLVECTGGALQAAAATNSAHAAQLAQVLIASGMNCRLSYSGGNLVLNRYKGLYAYIPGSGIVTIPAGGITLAPSGLTASTLYYIYLTAAGTLMASATGHVTDSKTGIEVMSGDNTKLLVGMEYATGATTWGGLCRSWYNDTGFAATTPLTSNAVTSSASLVELSTTLRTPFLLFSGETVTGVVTGTAANNSPANVSTSVGFDGATAEDACNAAASAAAGAGTPVSLTMPKAGLAEGYHYMTVLAAVSSGTGTWAGSGAKGTRCVASVSIPPRK